MERYDALYAAMRAALFDLAILAGDRVGDTPWQDVAQTAAINLERLAKLLRVIGSTHTDQGVLLTGSVVFPSPREVLDGA